MVPMSPCSVSWSPCSLSSSHTHPAAAWPRLVAGFCTVVLYAPVTQLGALPPSPSATLVLPSLIFQEEFPAWPPRQVGTPTMPWAHITMVICLHLPFTGHEVLGDRRPRLLRDQPGAQLSGCSGGVCWKPGPHSGSPRNAVF